MSQTCCFLGGPPRTEICPECGTEFVIPPEVRNAKYCQTKWPRCVRVAMWKKKKARKEQKEQLNHGN